MYCNNCGQQINDDAVVCPYCGVQVQALKAEPKPQETQQPAQPQAQQTAPTQNASAPAAQSNTVGIVGFVLSFFFPLAGLICSIIGLKKANQGAPYKGLCIAGIIISAIWVFLQFILMVTCTCTAIAAAGAAGGAGSDYYYLLSMI